jgi:hypothetical protein
VRYTVGRDIENTSARSLSDQAPLLPASVEDYVAADSRVQVPHRPLHCVRPRLMGRGAGVGGMDASPQISFSQSSDGVAFPILTL